MIHRKGAARKKQSARLAFELTMAAVLSVLAGGGGQARMNVAPATFGAGLPGIRAIDSVVMPPVDEATYLQEDQDRLAQGKEGPQRFAVSLETHLSPAVDGTWIRLPDSSRVWRLGVISVGARSLNFGFTTFRLPPGAMLHVYPADRREYWGAYTGEDATDNQLWTPVVRGDEAVVELYVPAHSAFEPELVLGRVGHDYRGFRQIKERLEKSGVCNNDVVCPEGAPWNDEINSEGVYTVNGTWTCSGQMINSHASPPPAYFLTASHCGISSSNAPSVVIYWNYQSPVCGQQGGGSLAQYSSGTALKAKWSTSDFCLVQLSQTPDPAFQLYLAGFDATEANAPTSSTCIHHPDNDEKSISFDYDPPTITTYRSNSVPGNGTHWRIIQWDDGTTEPGSSGAGLWDQNHRLVGQLHGGYASCTSLTSDWYGRLARSWDGDGTSGTRLRDWLDPNNTGNLVLDGRYYDEEETGACCFANGSCQLLAAAACAAAGGQTYLGDGTACETSPCPASGVAETEVAGAVNVRLAPNPAREEFEVSLLLPGDCALGIEMFDAAGRVVLARPARPFPAGEAKVSLAAVGRDGARLAPGLYFVRLTLDGRRGDARKLLLVP